MGRFKNISRIIWAWNKPGASSARGREALALMGVMALRRWR